MTIDHEPADIRVLDELGRRFEVVAAGDRSRSFRPRRSLAVVAGGSLVALAITPALASIVGGFNFHSSIEKTQPQVAAMIDFDDPAATDRALDRAGFDIQWSLVEDNPGGESPTTAREVAAPPPGTEIISVLGSDGSSVVTDDTEALLIEVAPTESEIVKSHR